MNERVPADVFTVTLAALLHDIGKPLQRAVRSNKATLSSNTRGIETQVGKGGKSYAHCLWTAEFINQQASTFHACGINVTELEKAASYHHNPASGDTAQHIVAYADRASAGMDRTDDDEHDTKCSYQYFERPLDALFTTVSLPEDTNSVLKPLAYRLGSLDGYDTKGIEFPSQPRSIEKDYRALNDAFSAEFAAIKTSGRDRFLETTLSLLQKYYWCVPSSTTGTEADIPLCDHLSTSAAIAACLASACFHHGASLNTAGFRLVSGDIAGIQDFIFSLSGESGRGIAKLLRGRSFAVGIMNMLAARMITAYAGLPSLCCIMCAGGRFKVLLPDTAAALEAVRRSRHEIAEWAHRRFFGDLKIIIDEGVVFSRDEFSVQSMADVLMRCDKSLAREKHRPLAATLCNENAWIDRSRYGSIAQRRACPVCGREPSGGEDTAGMRLPGENCSYFRTLGQMLVRGKYLAIREAQNEKNLLGRFDVCILPELDDPNGYDMLWRINLHEQNDGNHPLPVMIYAARGPSAEKVSEEDAPADIDITFETMAENAAGFKALAALKADVDNMGYILSTGFGSRLSISRTVSFSRMLNYFFAGYLPCLLRDRYPQTYTLFAGGDDLCLIGPWDRMIYLAADVQKQFTAYCGNAPLFSLSAGLELFKPAQPVVRAVACAEQALEHAKESGRNRIAIFRRALPWDEYRQQLEFAENWQNYVEHKRTKNPQFQGTAMLYRFLKYFEEWESNQNNAMRRLRHQFLFIYDIYRNLKEKDGEWILRPPFKDLIVTQIKKPLEGTTLFRNLIVGLSLSIYRNRISTPKKEDNDAQQ